MLSSKLLVIILISRILIINPVNTDIWNEVTLSTVKKVICSDTEVIVKNLYKGPHAIEYEYDREIVAPYVIEEVIKANKEGFNAIIINCFDDPGLEAAREISDVLVLGIGETSIIVSLTLGYKIAIISTGKHSNLVYYKKTIALGIKDRIAYTSGIDINVLDIRKNIDKVKQMLLNEIKKAISDYGAEVIVLGCSGLIGLSEELSKIVHVPIIDPTLITIKTAEALIKLSIKHNKILGDINFKH
jgi:allantoin racemase